MGMAISSGLFRKIRSNWKILSIPLGFGGIYFGLFTFRKFILSVMKETCQAFAESLLLTQNDPLSYVLA
jgi:hypothetical protein